MKGTGNGQVFFAGKEMMKFSVILTSSQILALTESNAGYNE